MDSLQMKMTGSARLTDYSLQISLLFALLLFVTNLSATTLDSESVILDSPLYSLAKGKIDARTVLEFDTNTYANLHTLSDIQLHNFPLSDGSQVTLQLQQFHITTGATRIVAGTELGDVPLAAPEVLLFKGHILNRPESIAFVGITPEGLWANISTAQKLHIVTPVSGSTASGGRLLHQLYESTESFEPPNDQCGLQPGIQARQLDAQQLALANKAVQSRIARIAIEADYEYWSRFNNINSALAYIYLLFGNITAIYENDLSVKLVLPFIRIWNTASDPYDYVGGDITGLNEFITYWNANHSTPGSPGFVQRDLAHLLSSRSVGAWASTATLCSYSAGYSISGWNGAAIPVEDSLAHDIAFVAHELGHNFNGLHTHCFTPPIDKCATDPGCNQTVDCSTAPGTLMSYCHNCLPNSSLLHMFHAQNVARMRTHIDSSCLALALNPAYVDWRNTGAEEGTLARPFNTLDEGVNAVLPGGILNIQNGQYLERPTLWQPMIINATGGTAVIGE